MIKTYYVTLLCSTGKYKPVTTVVKKDSDIIKDIGRDKYVKEIKRKGIERICAQRFWGSAELSKYGYTKTRVKELVKPRERGFEAL